MTTTTADHENRSDAHDNAPQRPSYDDVNVPVVFLVGVISMILTFVTIWFVEGVFYQWKNTVVNEVSYEKINTIQTQAIDDQKAKLAGDAEKGITSFDSVIDGVVGKYKNSNGSESHDEAAHSEAGH